MDHSRWDELKQLVANALERSPEERQDFLREACGNDDELLADAIAQLDAAAAAADFLPSAQPLNTTENYEGAQAIADNSWIGPFRLLDRIGEGGMGTVYLAEQSEPVRRRVALKLIRRELHSRDALTRFEAERQALALMNHTNIAGVLDAGTTADGLPYFVMEYVQGTPITTYCDRERLTTRERLELFVQVCEGVQHAHQKGIIHRDLKPSNVLVSLQGDQPIAKIIDFGIAKAIGQRLAERTLYTELGQIVGTPEYMSPEQAEGAQLDIDTRTDIYSLGAVLYELLVGVLPFDSEDLRAAGYAEIQRIIREVEPPKPSTRLNSVGLDAGAVAKRHRTEQRRLARRLRGDLDWITMKSLEKSRVRRYESAAQFAEDILRYLRHEPVMAGPPTLRYRLGKFVRKHRVGVAASAAVTMALVAGLIVSLWALDREQVARTMEAAARGEADTARTRAQDNLAIAEERLAEIIRLSDIKRLQNATVAAENLYPAYPDRLDDYEHWMARYASPLRERLPQHITVLSRLRSQATEAAGNTWTFANTDQQWQHDTLSDLIRDLEVFLDTDPFVGVVASVEKRTQTARTIADKTLTAPSVAKIWQQTLSEIRSSSLYGPISKGLSPQIGLVPLGADPNSGLQEFLHWETHTGPLPQRDPSGKLLVTAEMGVIMILVPGGSFFMGAQSTNSNGRHYDPICTAIESPVHNVTLEAFFLAKYEVTQAQWLRTMGSNPSTYSPSYELTKITPQHPVENVDWHTAKRWLGQLGLVLPTEAQWEYAARAGTTSRWWTGSERESLRGMANLADQSAARLSMNWSTIRDWPDLDDGYPFHAPVTSMPPNAFGLHHVHGNVGEWCLDACESYTLPVQPGTGERPSPKDEGGRAIRSGAYNFDAGQNRVTQRFVARTTYVSPNLGIRPARRIDNREW